jgi:hypothetical protein
MQTDIRGMALAPVLAIVLFSVCLKVSNGPIGDAASAAILGSIALFFLVLWRKERSRSSQADRVPWMFISMGIVSGVMLINSLSY